MLQCKCVFIQSCPIRLLKIELTQFSLIFVPLLCVTVVYKIFILANNRTAIYSHHL